MEAMLGIFESEWFRQFRYTESWISYPFNPLLSQKEFDKSCGFSELTVLVVQKAERTHFFLDNLKLPLNLDLSITCQELQAILDADLVHKIQFWLNGKKIETQKVLKLIETVKSNEITFNNINFDSL